MNTRHTLVCTVGTSLLETNLSRLPQVPFDPPPQWQALKAAFEASQWRQLAQELLQIDPTHRVCGAEINTIEETVRRGRIPLQHLVLLVSDTERGRQTGEVLKHYFRGRRDLKLQTVEYDVVESLQDADPKRFRVHGLRNLVRRIGYWVQRFGREHVAIDATGGYKAQIAVAVIIGQAMDLPVFYKHERFSEIIDFPPLPIAFDWDVLAQHADALTLFEQGKAFSGEEIGEVSERLRVLLTEVEVDGQTLYELSPLGQVYVETFRVRYPRAPSLKPAENREPPRLGDHHYPAGLEQFMTRLWQENLWVTRVYTLDYSGQASIRGIGFRVQEQEGTRLLVATYRDHTGFGARFAVRLSSETPEDLAWAAEYLNRRYAEP